MDVGEGLEFGFSDVGDEHVRAGALARPMAWVVTVRRALNRALFDPSTNPYGRGSQTAAELRLPARGRRNGERTVITVGSGRYVFDAPLG